MERRRYDVVVVGGGPAGCMAARYAAKAGVSTLLLEEHASIGEPVHCAGLLSTRALAEGELENPEWCVSREIKGAVIYSPSHQLLLESPTQRAYAVRRDRFDQALANAAVKAGAELMLKCTVKMVQIGDAGCMLTVATETPKVTREITARVVIGADGVRSTVARSAGLRTTQRYLHCGQIEGDYEAESNYAEIFVGKGVAPGFFAWAIPLDTRRRARIGLCIDRQCASQTNPLAFLKRNLAEHRVLARKFGGAVFLRSAGTIPLPMDGGKRKKTLHVAHGSGILLVGDAAAQIKPITGGGVYYGLRCGKLAGAQAAQACLTGDMTVLHDYERRWRAELGREIAFGLMVHRLRCVMNDRDYDTLIRTISESELVERIAAKGDMDYPSLALRGLIRNPQLLPLMARSIVKYLYTRWSKVN
ncbi:MAG TPA: NAD(P)/FAD-dependent oxidoreductase [Methanomicrobia archaeon]|nr:NAD(P)/FAD-dependent oxidoreductase [Methanomicrobia archaeon]